MTVRPVPQPVERFRPGGVLEAIGVALLETALCLVLVALATLAGERSQATAGLLLVAAALWGVFAVYGFAVAALRARVFGADLENEGVTLHTVLGARRYRYQELSAVEVTRGRTRLVARDGRLRRVRGVRGQAQGARFRTRVLARATQATRARAGPADRLGPGGEDGGDAAPPARSGG